MAPSVCSNLACAVWPTSWYCVIRAVASVPTVVTCCSSMATVFSICAVSSGSRVSTSVRAASTVATADGCRPLTVSFRTCAASVPVWMNCVRSSCISVSAVSNASFALFSVPVALSIVPCAELSVSVAVFSVTSAVSDNFPSCSVNPPMARAAVPRFFDNTSNSSNVWSSLAEAEARLASKSLTACRLSSLTTLRSSSISLMASFRSSGAPSNKDCSGLG